MSRPWRLCRWQRAQGLVEAALGFPLLLLVVLGMLQFALYYHARDVLTGAAQEGARLAAEDGRTLEEGVARAGELVVAGLGATTEPVAPIATAQDDVVEVMVAAQLRPIIPLPITAPIVLQAQARVSRERFRPDRAAP